MTRRQRGLQHIISMKDKLLDSCHPTDISWIDSWRIIMSEFHSNKWSTDNAFLTNEKWKNKQTPVCSPSLSYFYFYLFSLINFTLPLEIQ